VPVALQAIGNRCCGFGIIFDDKDRCHGGLSCIGVSGRILKES
jgi:hypothetical protein